MVSDFYVFAGEHPFLTFILFTIVADAVVRVTAIVNNKCNCSCDVEEEDADR